jgi:hypothetical protein
MGKRHYFKFLSINRLARKTALKKPGFMGKVPKKVVQMSKTGPVLLRAAWCCRTPFGRVSSKKCLYVCRVNFSFHHSNRFFMKKTNRLFTVHPPFRGGGGRNARPRRFRQPF